MEKKYEIDMATIEEVIAKREELNNKPIEELILLCSDLGINYVNFSKSYEIKRAILEKIFGTEKVLMYEDYLRLQDDHKRQILYKTIDTLDREINVVSELYDRRKKLLNERSNINEKIRSIKMRMVDFPNIKVGTAYGLVDKKNNEYRSLVIRGMLRTSEVKDEIADLNRRSGLIRRINSSKINELKDRLDELEAVYQKKSNAAYEEFTSEYDTYKDLLRRLTIDFFNSSKEIKDAVIEAVQLFRGIKIKFVDGQYVDETNNKTISDDEMYEIFIDYANFDPDELMETNMFIERLECFVLSFYQNKIKMIDIELANIGNQIRASFGKQVDIVKTLNANKDILYTSEVEDTKLYLKK